MYPLASLLYILMYAGDYEVGNRCIVAGKYLVRGGQCLHSSKIGARERETSRLEHGDRAVWFSLNGTTNRCFMFYPAKKGARTNI